MKMAETHFFVYYKTIITHIALSLAFITLFSCGDNTLTRNTPYADSLPEANQRQDVRYNKSVHLQQKHMNECTVDKQSANVYTFNRTGTTIAIIITVPLVALAFVAYIRIERRAHLRDVMKYKKQIDTLKRTRIGLCSIHKHRRELMAHVITEKCREIELQRKSNDDNKRQIHKLEQSIDRLHRLGERQKAEYINIIKDKDALIEELNRKNKKYEKINAKGCNIDKYADKTIVKQLKHHARKDFVHMSSEEMAMLKEVVIDEPEFRRIENIVNDNEYIICLLVRTGFTPSDISILTDLSQSNISNIRKRLLMKLTGIDGSPKDFDTYIISL